MTQTEAINLIEKKIKSITGEVIDYKEGLGIFDIGKLTERMYLKTSSISVELPPSSYYVCESLLPVQGEGIESSLSRLVPGDNYLICYLGGRRPVILDRIRKGDSLGTV